MARFPAHSLLFAVLMLLPLLVAAPVQAQSLEDFDRLQGLDPESLRQQLRGRGDHSGLEASEQVLRPRQGRQPLETGPSRVEELFSERAGERVRQFGYATFANQDAVVLRQTGAIQDSYVLGQGDEVIVTIRGQENQQYRQRIDRNGQIILPRLEPVPAAGRSVGAFRADMEAAISRAFIGTSVFVSLGEIRQVSVLVAGEVAYPGAFTLTGLSTPVDALILAGGIKKTGSLRTIRVMRGGRALEVDLYSLLAGTPGEPAFHLQEGDRIVVPALGRTVAAVGTVRRPGIYELSGGRVMGADDLVRLAGGVEVRGAYRFVVQRTRADGIRVFEELSGLNGATIQDGDILFVQPAVDRTVGRVSLRGHTRLAGEFSLGQSGSLRDLLGSPSALREAPYLQFGIISRLNPSSFTRELLAFSPARVMTGAAQVPMREDDIVWVFSIEEARRLGSAARTEQLERLERQRDLFVAEQRRALTRAEDGDALSSRIGMESAGRSADPLNQDAIAAGALAAGSFQTEEQRRILLAQQADRQRLLEQERTLARGRAFPPDRFEQDRMGERRMDRFSQDPRFTEPFDARQPEPLDLDTLADGLMVDRRAATVFLTEYIATIRGAVRVPGYYLIAPDTALASLVGVSGGLKRTADLAGVEITTTAFDNARGRSETLRRTISLNETPFDAIAVQPQDSVVLRDVFSERFEGRVNIFGEVRFPGSYEIVRGEKLSSLLARAGNLTDGAFPYGAIFSRRSVARLERESNVRKAEDLQNLIVSQSSRREFNAEQLQFLQGLVMALRDAEPIGRIAVEIDPDILAAKPELDVELEPGDALYIPSRPSTVTVTGQVLNAGSFQFRPGEKARHYVNLAGSYNDLADEGRVFVIYPDGTSERVKDSFWRFGSTRIVPGSVIVVPYDVTPFFFSDFIRDTVQVTSQIAITAASVAAVTN